MNEPIELKDKRKFNFYQIDNKILDIIRNPYAIAVYNCLVCYAFSSKKCFPSIDLLAYKCNVSKPTIFKAIKLLEEKKLISVIRECRGSKRTRKGNIYYINDISDYKKCIKENHNPSPSSDLGPKPVSPDDRAMKLPKTGNEAEVKQPASAPSRRSTTPPAKPKPPPKKTYGEYKNVRLTEAEHMRVKEKYGEEAEDFIEWYSAKKESKGYRYASDSAVFRVWGFDGYEKQKHWQASKKVGRSKKNHLNDSKENYLNFEGAHITHVN